MQQIPRYWQKPTKIGRFGLATLILVNIMGPNVHFSNPIFALKPWAQAGRFKYHEPYKQNNFFSSYIGGCRFLKLRTPQLKPLKIENDILFSKTYMIYHNDYYQHIWKCDFFNFQPTLIPIENPSLWNILIFDRKIYI